MQTVEGQHHLVEITARFEPVRRDDLQGNAASWVGKEMTFRWIGTGNADEPYPGQNRWMNHDEGGLGYWVPDEDLKLLEWRDRTASAIEGIRQSNGRTSA